MNQPHMAPWWFPANDHPLDKALVDIRITVPRRQAGRRQRPPGLAHGPRRPRDVPLEGRRADGAVPRVLRRRPLRGLAGHPRRPAVAGRGVAAAAAGGAPGVDGLMERTPDDRRVARDPARRLPVQPDRRAGDQPAARLRPGEPDPADVPGVGRAQHRRARARAPVVRRLRGRARGGATSGSTRASPPSWRRRTTRRTAAGTPSSGWSRRGRRSAPTTRSGSSPIGDPGPDQHLRLAGLRARRDDAAGAAAPHRRDGVLDDPAHLGGRPRGRQRHHRGVPALAEQVSGEDLDAFFQAWLFDGARPAHTADNGF